MTRALVHPLSWLLIVMSLQWMFLAEFGQFTVLVPYVALVLVAAFFYLSPRGLRGVFAVLQGNAMWIAPLALYLLMATLLLSDSLAANTAPRQLFYMMGAIGVAGGVATMRRPARVFRVGAVAGLAVLILEVEFLARGIGLSWIDALTEFFFHGNLHFVMYKFFTPIFNSLDQTADMFPASTKNSIAGCVLILGLLFRSASTNPERDVPGMAFLLVTLLLVLMLNDRSVIISAGVCLLIASGLAVVTRPGSSRYWLAVKMMGVLAASIIAVGMSISTSALSGTLTDRFAFEDKSADARLEQYREAFGKIAENPIAGNGFFEVDGYVIHNVFLSAWAYTGVVAFILVIIFYFVLLARWVQFLMAVVKRPQMWVLPLAVEWIAPLPFMPLFRVWISGEGGVFKFAEWVAIALFFGLVTANHIMARRAHAWHRKRAAQPVDVQPAWSPVLTRSSVGLP